MAGSRLRKGKLHLATRCAATSPTSANLSSTDRARPNWDGVAIRSAGLPTPPFRRQARASVGGKFKARMILAGVGHPHRAQPSRCRVRRGPVGSRAFSCPPSDAAGVSGPAILARRNITEFAQICRRPACRSPAGQKSQNAENALCQRARFHANCASPSPNDEKPRPRGAAFFSFVLIGGGFWPAGAGQLREGNTPCSAMHH